MRAAQVAHALIIVEKAQFLGDGGERFLLQAKTVEIIVRPGVFRRQLPQGAFHMMLVDFRVFLQRLGQLFRGKIQDNAVLGEPGNQAAGKPEFPRFICGADMQCSAQVEQDSPDHPHPSFFGARSDRKRFRTFILSASAGFVKCPEDRVSMVSGSVRHVSGGRAAGFRKSSGKFAFRRAKSGQFPESSRFLASEKFFCYNADENTAQIFAPEVQSMARP